MRAARKTVTDRKGKTLAVSVPTVSLAAHIPLIRNKERTAEKLAAILPSSREELLEKLENSKRMTWLERDLSYETAEAISELRLNGVSTLQEFRRFYPQGRLAATLLGRVGRDGEGQSGVELAFEEALSRSDMRLQLNRDARGKLVAVRDGQYDLLRDLRFVKDASPTEPENVVQMTIDGFVQNVLESEFREAQQADIRQAGLCVS